MKKPLTDENYEYFKDASAGNFGQVESRDVSIGHFGQY